ncbi:hypothetical protein AB0K18_38090 [Nonomuraea sp. NPDC049421]|uniref:hypothetical protein n=1 Tax=Nonomuraea sp. NPDC049421 TaxID=3155275 RepID=UPI003442C827
MSFIRSALPPRVLRWAHKTGSHLYAGLVMLGTGFHAPALTPLWDRRTDPDIPDHRLTPSERATWHRLTASLTSDEKP